MKRITIDGYEYMLEYTIGASLYDDCVVSVTQLLTSLAFHSEEGAGGEGDDRLEKIKSMIGTVGGLPRVAVTVFYAGLMEHHGAGEYAGAHSDKKVVSFRDARLLAAKWVEENKDGGDATLFDLFTLCLDCMGEDGFFQMVGLDKMLSNGQKGTEAAEAKEEATP